MATIDRELTRFIHRAYIRDGERFHTGEAMFLACLVHARGKSRKSDDMKDLKKIMKDINS